MLNNVSFFVEKCFMEPNSTTLDPFRSIFVIGRNTFVPDSIVKNANGFQRVLWIKYMFNLKIIANGKARKLR